MAENKPKRFDFDEFFVDTEPLPKAKEEPTDYRAMLSRFVNIAGGAYGGARIGGMAGSIVPGGSLPGAAIGGLVGGGAAALAPTSEEPITDASAFMGEIGAERLAQLIPDGRARAIAKLVGVPVAVAMSSTLGSRGDQAFDFIQETPYGKIGIFAGASVLSQGLNQWLRSSMKPTAALNAVDDLKTFLGTKDPMPLSVSESTGVFEGLERGMLFGTKAERTLGQKQNEYAVRAFEKIADGEIEKRLDVAENAGKIPATMRRMTDPKTANQDFLKRVHVKDDMGKPAFNPDGTPKMKIEFNWDEFRSSYGLTKGETAAFLTMMKQTPEKFIEAMFPFRGKDNLRGLAAIRALTKVFDSKAVDSTGAPLADPESYARLGTGLVMRMLSRNGAFKTNPQTGEVMLDGMSFTKSLLSDFGIERIRYALGPERAEAMRQLGVAMAAADPRRKITGQRTSETQRTMSYVAHKLAFSVMSLGAGSTAGAAVSGGAMMGALAGGTAGAAFIIPLNSMVAKLLTEPAAGRLLLAAAKGDGTAATALTRSFFQGVGQDEPYGKDRTKYSTPKSRLEGLFESGRIKP